MIVKGMEAWVVGQFLVLELQAPIPNYLLPSRETILHHGDLLAIYSDGVTEAMNEVGEQFSEARFIASLREFRSFSPAPLLTNVVRTVQEFAGGWQSDDLTLVIARAL